MPEYEVIYSRHGNPFGFRISDFDEISVDYLHSSANVVLVW